MRPDAMNGVIFSAFVWAAIAVSASILTLAAWAMVSLLTPGRGGHRPGSKSILAEYSMPTHAGLVDFPASLSMLSGGCS